MPLALGIISVVISAASAAYQAYQQGEMQDKQDEALAKQAEQQRQATAVKSAQEREAGKVMAAKQRALDAASGVVLDEAGSTSDVLAKNLAAKTESNINLIQTQGAWAMENIGSQREINAVANPLVSGIFSGASGVLNAYTNSLKLKDTSNNPLESQGSTINQNFQVSSGAGYSLLDGSRLQYPSRD